MSCLQDVPFRMTVDVFEDSLAEASFAQAPELVMPNREEILMNAMHDFLLEKKVLYWIESASQQNIPWYSISADVVPTAPPCWLLLVDSKENVTTSHQARSSKVKNMTPIQRCVNLCAAAEKFSCTKNKAPLAGKTEDDQHAQDEGCSEGEESSSTESDVDEESALDFKRTPNTLPRFLSLPQCRPKTSPVLLAASLESSNPKPPLVKQKRSMFLFSNVKNELQGARKKITAFMHPSAESTLASRAFSLHQRSRSSKNMRYGLTSDVSLVGTLVPTPPPNPRCSQSSHATRRLIPPVQSHKPTVASLSPYSRLPPTPGIQQSLGSHRTVPDATADLLSALSQEERDLIEPVLALGYPIRRAILALQKTGRQSLGQFLSYLSACDKLLKQGYEEAQVEEAMEMFQNSEKAAEFLHLLAQFNDMGFRQADIKEVLLLCENHRDRALEELMTRTQ